MLVGLHKTYSDYGSGVGMRGTVLLDNSHIRHAPPTRQASGFPPMFEAAETGTQGAKSRIVITKKQCVCLGDERL